MKVIRIEGDILDFYADMDPLFFAERMVFPDRFCLGALMETEEGDIPAGMMICRQTKDALWLEWLCVREGYRLQGVGGRLMSEAYKYAQEAGFSYLGAYISREFGRETVCPMEQDYLEDYEFVKKCDLPGEWLTDARSLKKYFDQKGPEEHGLSTVSLGKLDSAEEKEYLERIPQARGGVFLYEGAWRKGNFDEEVSCVCYKNKKIIAALFLQHSGSTLYVTGILAHSRAEMNALLKKMAEMVEEKYGETYCIRLIQYSDHYNEIPNEMIPEDKVESFLMVSDVEKRAEKIENTEWFEDTLLCAGI